MQFLNVTIYFMNTMFFITCDAYLFFEIKKNQYYIDIEKKFVNALYIYAFLKHTDF